MEKELNFTIVYFERETMTHNFYQCLVTIVLFYY